MKRLFGASFVVVAVCCLAYIFVEAVASFIRLHDKRVADVAVIVATNQMEKDFFSALIGIPFPKTEEETIDAQLYVNDYLDGLLSDWEDSQDSLDNLRQQLEQKKGKGGDAGSLVVKVWEQAVERTKAAYLSQRKFFESIRFKVPPESYNPEESHFY